MGKRSSFPRMKNDAYDTPPEAVLPLLPHLPAQSRFIEPCVGLGRLAYSLLDRGFQCVGGFDVEPRLAETGSDAETLPIWRDDAATFKVPLHLAHADYFITNPPWTRELLHPIIFNLFWQLPTWLLLDASWMHTRQAAPYMAICRKIVSVGRVKWIEGSKHSGKDDAAWYLFAANGRPEFVGRSA